jgi:hypothetical protein
MKNHKDDTFDLSEAIKGLKTRFDKNAEQLSNCQIADWLEELDERCGYTHPDANLLYQTLETFRSNDFNNAVMIATPDTIADWLKNLYELRINAPIEYYGEAGAKDNIKEYQNLCKELANERKINKGEESNVECLIIDKICELISKMKLVEIKTLKLFE